MKAHVRRRLLIVLTGLSTGFCVAVTVLWMLSYFQASYFEWVGRRELDGGRDWRHVRFDSARGGVLFEYRRAAERGERTYRAEWSGYDPGARGGAGRVDGYPYKADPARPPAVHFFGFVWDPYDCEMFGRRAAPGSSYWCNAYILVVPHWPLALATSVFPAIMIRGERRSERRRRTGCCEACGYNLRESPDRCPECGRRARVLR